MNCQICQKEIEAYFKGTLSEELRKRVEVHLKNCNNCTESYNVQFLTDMVIKEEKSIVSNPFLTTRIMAQIEEIELNRQVVRPLPLYRRILRPALIGIFIAAAIVIGIAIGNIYTPSDATEKLPIELAYMNDAALVTTTIFTGE